MNEKVRKAWKAWAVEIAIFLALFVGIRAWQGRNVATGAVPRLELRTLDGAAVRLGEPRERPLMLHFWATWCGVCTAESGNVSSVVDATHDVLTIAASSGSDDQLRRAMVDKGLHWPVVNDASGSLAQAFGVSAFPTTLYVTREGTIRTAEVGYTTTLGMRARLWWAGL